jgi:hypothetical protein
VLRLDETILTETPPLRCCYGRIGHQVSIPLTGNHAKRILQGVLNVTTGDLLALLTDVWDGEVILGQHVFHMPQIVTGNLPYAPLLREPGVQTRNAEI